MAVRTSLSGGDGFRGPQACKVVGITYRQLDHWARIGLVTPSVAAAAGSGTQRLYAYTDLLELKVIKRLLDAGFSLQKIRKVFAYIRKELEQAPTDAQIVWDGDRVYACRSEGEIVDVLSRGQLVFPIANDRVRAELDGSIAQLRPAPPEPGQRRRAAGDA